MLITQPININEYEKKQLEIFDFPFVQHGFWNHVGTTRVTVAQPYNL